MSRDIREAPAHNDGLIDAARSTGRRQLQTQFDDALLGGAEWGRHPANDSAQLVGQGARFFFVQVGAAPVGPGAILGAPPDFRNTLDTSHG